MSEQESSEQPSDKMRERIDESTWKLWVLMEANRWTVAAALVFTVFVSMVLIGTADPSPLQHSMEVSDPAETLFQGFLTTIITGVTLVVTLNQLVLSQELGPVGDQKERMKEAMQFREDVENVIEEVVSPQQPSKFLKSLLDQVEKQSEELESAVGDQSDEIHEYIAELKKNAGQVSKSLESSEFGNFTLLSAVLNFNYSWKIAQTRRIKKEHGEKLGEDVTQGLEDLEETLKLFGPAREHFKTLYFQWELVNLSRTMLYTALPALIVAASMIVFYDPTAVSGYTLGLSNDVILVSMATAVSVTPFMLLLSYILRIATVAKRTLSIGPFVLRDEDRNTQIS
ncbi:hypothetical protein GKQ38_00240 [Candidatus Nanohaloarchaea archaeon]|nr:hypothetical protein GKQ38_00240 [Candidatus Nanohaloarchaea archaeon]